MATKKKSAKYVYFFGGGKADGNESMKNLLGGKGANLAEMAGHPKLKLPVPPGFTVTTEVCTYYYQKKRNYPKVLNAQVLEALGKMEKITGKKFGDIQNPLLLSVRSGARRSMPGMMETVLNIGLNEQTIKGIIGQSGNPRFAYDAYRRLIMMYADVVMEKAGGIEVKGGKGIRKLLDEKLEHIKHTRGYTSDTELTVEELKELVNDYKKTIKKVLGSEFPDDPFQTIDQDGVGQLIKAGTERGRENKPSLKVGICGEHGGDPESVKFCYRIGMNYVSCSPFRVPIARLAAAQAALETPRQK